MPTGELKMVVRISDTTVFARNSTLRLAAPSINAILEELAESEKPQLFDIQLSTIDSETLMTNHQSDNVGYANWL